MRFFNPKPKTQEPKTCIKWAPPSPLPKFWPPPAATLVHQGAWDTFCGVSTDSRTSQTGELFIPLTGERHDGHEFIPAALRRGARGVLVEAKNIGAAGEARA